MVSEEETTDEILDMVLDYLARGAFEYMKIKKEMEEENKNV